MEWSSGLCWPHLSHDLQCENVHFVGSYFLEHLGILKNDGHGMGLEACEGSGIVWSLPGLQHSHINNTVETTLHKIPLAADCKNPFPKQFLQSNTWRGKHG